MTAAIEGMLQRIPYLEPTPVDVLDQRGGAVRMRLPFGRPVTNIVGTVHAGALFTLAETAAGVAAFGVIPGAQPMVLLRHADVRYTRRADSDITAMATVAEGAPADIAARFADDGRADVTIAVTIADASGTGVFEGTYDYALRRGQA